MTDLADTNRLKIVERLGFTPSKTCSKCPNVKVCHRLERTAEPLLCELSDADSGVGPEKMTAPYWNNRDSDWDIDSEPTYHLHLPKRRVDLGDYS